MRGNKQTRTLEFSLVHHPISQPGTSVSTQTDFGLQPISQRGSWDVKAPDPMAVSRAASPDETRLPAWLPAGGSLLGVSSRGPGSGRPSDDGWRCDLIRTGGLKTHFSFHAAAFGPKRSLFPSSSRMTCRNRLAEAWRVTERRLPSAAL